MVNKKKKKDTHVLSSIEIKKYDYVILKELAKIQMKSIADLEREAIREYIDSHKYA